MNIAEGQRLKALEAAVAALQAQVAELTRRLDESRTLKLKKDAA